MVRRPSHQVSGDPIYQPDPVHLRQRTNALDDGRDDASTEPDDGDDQLTVPSRPRPSRRITQGKPSVHWYDRALRFWRHHVRLAVPYVDCRDHYGECVCNVIALISPYVFEEQTRLRTEAMCL